MNQFDLLKLFSLSHVITNRLGGVSEGAYGQMDTNFYNAERFDETCENIKRVLDAQNMDAKFIIATRQTHSTTILNIDDSFDFTTLIKYDTENTALSGVQLFSAHNTDGLMTKRKDVILMTFYADCVPLLIYDEENHVICTLHSGWRGTASLMGKHGVDQLQSLYDSKPSNLWVGIGHSAGSCCYEVDEPVREAFSLAFDPQEMALIFIDKGNQKYNIDLKLANKMIFNKCGIPDEHIQINPDCTICHFDIYHSHRAAQGGPRGSMSAFVQLK